MDRIEQSIRLPREGLRLKDYARYYAYADNGTVEALYERPFSSEATEENVCEDVVDDAVGDAAIPCPAFETPYPDLKANERAWVNDSRSLPGINDGGCSVISFTYDPKTDRFPNPPQCNGEG